MRWLTRLFGKRKLEAQLDAELRFHIEQRTTDLIASGIDPTEARRRALVEFGGVERAKEECRQARGTYFLESVLTDIRYALRTLRKSPGFTLVAILTLALGIGANTAIFSVTDAVLLRPLPYKNPGQLVWVALEFPKMAMAFVPHPTYFAWREENRAFSGLAATAARKFTLTGAGNPTRIPAAAASANLFSVLGAEPVRGRTFSPAEERPGGPRAVVLSYGLWQSRFGANSGILGRTVILDDKTCSVVGVLPRGFRYPAAGPQPELFVPLGLSSGFAGPDIYYLHVVGRLRAGVTRAQAAANLTLIDRRTLPLYPKWFGRYSQRVRIEVVSLHHHLAGSSKAPLLALLAAASLILLIACANIASLQLSRGSLRAGEFSLRLALGAPRFRLARQVLTESLILAVAGGLAGLLGGMWGMMVLRSFVPSGLRSIQNIRLGAGALVFTVAISALAGVLAGLAPILAAVGTSPIEVVRRGLGRMTGPNSGGVSRRLLTITEIAAAMVLTICAGLTLRSYVRLTGVKPGFDPHDLFTARIELPLRQYPHQMQLRTFSQQLLRRIGTLPGVRQAALATSPPNAPSISMRVGIAGRPAPSPTDAAASVHLDAVSEAYFRTLEVSIIRGRTFGNEDGPQSAKVAIVNEAFVRQFFSDGENPMAQRILLGDTGPGKGTAVSIVGVVGDFRRIGVAEPPPPQIFLPLAQGGSSSLVVLLRTKAATGAVASALREQVMAIDKDLPISRVATMDALLARETSVQRFSTKMMGMFAALALLLAAVGVFGVMSYMVSRRRHEIAVRVALGARPSDVSRLVFREGLALTSGGIALGAAVALGVTRYLRSLLFQIRPTDPLTFAGVAVLLTAVALLACYVPVRRAMRVDPNVALRQE